MKRIEKFEADDGTRFDTEQECLDYENSRSSERAIEKLIMEFTTDFTLQLKLGRFFRQYEEQILDILTGNNSEWISNENNPDDFAPIKGNPKVEVVYRNGTYDRGLADMWNAGWRSADYHPKDIVKYRVIND